MKKLLSFFVLGSIFASSLAQVITPFSVRKTITQKGGIIYLSNTSSKANPNNVVQNEMPPAGTGYDNNFTNGYVDIDTDATTWMSSSDSLNLPNCSEVSWAGLYWGAEISSTDANYATRNQVKLKVNNGAYLSLTADYIKDNATGFRTYHCFKDISSICKANGLKGRYTIANLATAVGGKNLFGGWTIVIVYKNNTQSMRNLTVFDGLANVSAGTYSTVDIPISGFQTPLAGPVTFELGLVVYDGDRSLTGDQLLFKGASSFINISDALHPITDMFNSTLAHDGVLTSFRNPSYNNTLGYDANIFAPDNTSKNFIGNNAISAVIRQTTGGETYLTQVVTSAIDVYEPDLRSAVRVKNITNPGSTTAERGDILEYTINGLNIGSDPSVNTFITDTIEGNATYVPGSLKITYGPNAGVMTDAVGDDQAEYIAASKVVKVRIGTGANSSLGGFVANSPIGTDSTQFIFRVQATNDCVYLACDSIINNSAFIIGTGNVSGNTFNNASNPGVFDAFGCPIPGSTQTLIHTAGCAAPGASANSPICQGGTINFTASASPSATYTWSGPNGFTSAIRQPSITNVQAVNAGTYTANIFITGTSCHFVYPFMAAINIADAGPDQIGNSTCGITTTTLAGNSPNGSTGIWSILAGAGGSFGNSSSPNSTFSGTPGVLYTLRWTLNSGGCPSTTDDVNVKFNQGATTSVLSGSSSICYNGYASVKVTITGGTSPYTVTLNNAGGTFTNYTSGNDIIVGPLTTSTTYSLVSVTDANGCSSSGLSGTATVTVSNAITGTGAITQSTPPATGTSGPNYAGTTSATGNNYNWTNPNNAKASDNVYATQAISGSKSVQPLVLSNFGFAIPSNATINGIEVVMDRHYTTAGTRAIVDNTIQLVKAGTATGSNKALTSTNWPLTTDATVTYPASNASTDLWGTTWTPADINASTFGLKIVLKRSSSGTNTPTGYIDYATIKVYYTIAYCDDATGKIFTVASYANATNYTWAPPSGGTVTAGQGTTSATMDFNGAGQSGSYNVCVTASNNCQTLSPSCISIPISDCVNSSYYIMGNVFWDTNAMTDNLVNGTGIGTANATQLYVTIEATAGTTALQNSFAVGSNGAYKFAVSASTAYKLVLSKNSYTTGQTVAAPALPSGCSFTGEKANNLTNTLTGNDGTVDGILNVTSLASNNVVNANFGIKISTPPVAVNDITSTNEDTPVTVNVTTNDTDVDGTVTASTVDLNTGTAGIQTSITNASGTWSVNALGVVTYTPTLNFNGNASVTYTVNDNDGNTSNTGTILVMVAPVNDAPVTVNDAVTTLEDTPVSINVLSNDYDVDGTVDASTVDLDPSTAGIQTFLDVTNQGTYSVNSLGVVTFTPALNYNGITTPITYSVKDNSGATSATATLTVTVTSVIDPPTADNDVATTNQNVPVSINVTTNDVGVDAPINVASVDLDPNTGGIQADFTVVGEGSYHANSSGIVTFTPVSSFYGTTTPVNYTVNDNLAHTSNTASLTITVIATSAPVAVNDAASTNEGASVTINVTTNDNAPNGSINVSRVDLDPSTAGIQQFYDIPGQGTFMVDMAGMVTFQPAWEFYGTVTGQYTVKDNLGLVSNVATITVTVIHVNQPPTAVDDIVTTNEDSPVVFNVTTNDFDADGSIAVNSVDLDPATAGRQTSYSVTGEGIYTVDNAGNVTFTPALNFNGTTTPIYYIVNDNQGLTSDISLPAIISISVVSVNDPPVAVNDAILAASNTNVVFNITTNDTDVDGTIDPTTVDLNPAFPGIQKTLSVTNEGTYTVDNAGIITFTPLATFLGPITTTTINYTVNDNAGATSNSASISITLSDPSAPQAVDDNATMNEDGTPVTIDVTANDNQGSGNIDITTIDLDPITAGQQTTVVLTQGTWDVNTTTGIVTFTPVANYFGTATINYIVYDDNATPLASNAATITVTVNAINDVPSFTKGSNQTVCENSGVQEVNNWAASLSAGPANESSQTLSFVVTNNNNSLFSLQPSVDASGNLSYTPAANQSGSATVSVNIKDNGGTASGGLDASAAQNFTITVTSQPAPVIGSITQPTCGTPTATIALSGLPSSGTWTLTPSTGSPVTGTGTTYSFGGLNASATYTFTTTNVAGCISGASSNGVINAIPSAPAIPTVLSTTQPTCPVPTGTIVFNTQGGVQYSVGSGYQAASTFAGLTPATYALSVRSIADNTCITSAASTVTINAIPSNPAAPSASASQAYCGIAAISDLTATPPVGSTVNWFASPTGGLALANGFALSNGGSYYAESQNTITSCISPTRTPVIAVISSIPLAPAGSATQNFCSTASPVVSDIVLTGTNITWYTTATGGSVVAGSTPLVHGATYYASQTVNGCESTSRLSVTISLNACNPAVTLSVNNPSIAEAGGIATFTATLSYASLQNITVNLGYSGTATGGGTDYTAAGTSIVIPAGSLTGFTTLTAVNDYIVEPTETIIVDINSVTNGTENGSQQVTTSIVDDDAAGINVSGISGHTTEAGGTATFSIVLTSQPTSNVNIGLSSNDLSEGTVSPASVIFTNGNWNTPQNITVTGVDDLIADGNITYSIITAAAVSADANYSGLNAADVTVINDDNDAPGITVSSISGHTTESGGTASFTIVLNTQPMADVTIGLSSNDLTEGTVNPVSVTFTNGNWNIPQTVTVTGVDDAVQDGNLSYAIITAAATSTDGVYAGLNANDVPVINDDNDVAGITVSTISGHTSEAGGTATFSLVLNTQPTANVTINLSSNDLTEGTISQASVTFSNGNWNTPQTITVTGVDDAIQDGNIPYSIVTAAATSADGNYAGLNANDVAVINDDNDVAGITVSPISGHTSESGGSATFTIALNTQPTGNVTINLSSSDLTEGTVNPGSVTFTSGNWNMLQTITVTGVDDAIADGNISYSIVTAAANSVDGNYAGMDAADVTVINDDNDVAGITVSAISGHTTEGGGSANFTIVLQTQPTANVSINLSSSNLAEGTVNPSIVTFTNGNWNIPQTVTVTGVDDAIMDGNVPYSIVTSPAISADLSYSGMNAADVPVVNDDNDVAGITVSAISGHTSESGGSATFTINLDSQPTANVTIGLSSSDLTEGSVTPASVQFTGANWNIAQTITVTGVDDPIVDGNISYTIVTAAASSSDGNYSAMNPADVTVINDDNDVAGITVSPVSSHTTEAGGTATFTIVLDSQPTADVSLNLSSSNIAEGTISPTNVTFTATNWNTPQTITVTGVDDAVQDGDITYYILTAPATSADIIYSGMVANDVTVVNEDNDVAGITVSPVSGNTTEAGGTATFTIVLDSQPTANVSIGLSSSDLTEGTVNTSSVTFTSANWDTPQTITVTGVDDPIIDGDVTYHILPAAATSADVRYNNMNAADIAVINEDDDIAGFTLSKLSALTSESGTTDNFTVVLNAQPASNVVISATSGDLTEGTVAPGTLTFTALNWNTPQTVTITGMDDAIADGSITYNVTISVVDGSSDDNFDPLPSQTVSVTNVDNDSPGITVSGISSHTTESGGTATFTIVLNTSPTADVSIGLSSNDLTEGTVNPATVTFTNANWNLPQTIVVTGLDDNIVDGNIPYQVITSAANSTDVNYNNLDPADVSVINDDDDTAGFTLSKTTASTSEIGTSDNFTVVLTAQPVSDVVINVSSGNLTEGTVSPGTITFTPLNWNTPQLVTVTGMDDAIADGPISYDVTLKIAAGSSDDNFDLLSDQTVLITNADNDIAGITVSTINGHTSEGGGTATFTMVLNSQPTADVTIGLSSSDLTEGTVSTANVTFTSATWNVPQTITVTGVDDAMVDGDITYTIFTAAAISADLNYSGMDANDVTVINDDDDVAGITVSPVSGHTTEAGGTATFTIVLNSQPTADVMINLNSSNLAEGMVSPSTVTLTSSDWDTPQIITITGVDDHLIDGNIAYNIITSAATSADGNYNNLDPADVSVINDDNDVAGYTISKQTALTSENGTTDNFTVVLDAQPASDVVISVVSGDLTEGTVFPAVLTFTSANWNNPQTITVSGIDDLLADGSITYNVTLSITDALSDDNFDALPDQTVSVTNIDNDSPGITVSAISNHTNESGGTATFVVVLNTMPTADVSIGLSSSDLTEGTVNPGSITFTAINWNIPQTVTVTGVADQIADGDITYTIVTDPAVSADVNYAGLDANDVTVINDDVTASLPNAVADVATMNEDGNATINVLANDTGLGNGGIVVTITVNGIHGTATVNADNTITYIPSANYNGSDVITYQVCDIDNHCSTATMTVTINPVNDPPGLASAVITQTMNVNGGSKTVDLSANTINVDNDILTISITIQPKHGNASINGSGQLVYTPNTDFAGNDTVTYDVCDNGAPPLCVTGTVIFTVLSIANHAPVVADLTLTTIQNQPLAFVRTNFTSRFTDQDNDTLVKIRFTSLPSHGTLQLNGVDVTVNQEIQWVDLNNLVFVPEPDYTGETSFSWEASDGQDYSTFAGVNITVTPKQIFIPQGFSPNNDGINETFVIEGADNYVVTLKVYNRWGNLVYESKHYKNDWDATANAGLLIGSKLPDGTYFYVIDFNNGDKEKIGYITINR